MRYWSYNEPVWDSDGNIIGNEVITKSDDDIIKEFYPYWRKRMIEKFGEGIVDCRFNELDCIDDWVVVNWAWESPP